MPAAGCFSQIEHSSGFFSAKAEILIPLCVPLQLLFIFKDNEVAKSSNRYYK